MSKFIFYSILLALSLSSCTGIGSKFFVRNYENKAVNVRYTYYNQAEFTDTTGFSYQPKNYVLVSNTLISKKIMRRFPYHTASYFDTLPVTKLNDLTYEVSVPAGSTIFIAPVFNYGDNVQSLDFNSDIHLQFVHDYPSVENQELRIQKLVKYRFSLVGNNYTLVNLKLAELDSILNK